MIRRLRWKFVLVNMALVAVVLAIVFTTVLVSNHNKQISEMNAAMRMAMMREEGVGPQRFSVRGGPPKEPEESEAKPENQFTFHPVFSVTIPDEGEVRIVDTGNVEVSDEVLTAAVEQALADGGREGVLASLNLRFLREKTPDGTRLAFADRSVAQAAQTQLTLTLLLVGLGGLAAFFVISVFLANWTLRPVERAWATQRRFVADASHELKTPLTVMLANLSILKNHADEPNRDQWIESTREEAVRMRKLVDALLFLAKTDAPEAPREQAQFSLTDAVWRSVLSFEPVAYEQGVSMSSDIAPDIDFLGDEGQIVQLATVLLDNACKYAGAHGEVFVRLEKESERIHLSVTNTGEVIAPEALSHIFERFYRTDSARTHVSGGYGLGLSIAAEIARQHGGKITAASDAEQGTTFTVSLPAHRRAGKNLA